MTETEETNPPVVEESPAEEGSAAETAAASQNKPENESETTKLVSASEADTATNEAAVETETAKPPPANQDKNGDNNENTSENDNDKENTTEETTNKKTAPPLELVEGRPPKRSRTAYFIFADAMRPKVQQEHQGVANQAKAIGALWKSIAEDERHKYKQLAASEKETYTATMAAYQAKFGSSAIESNANSSDNNSEDLIFPVARIRKIAKLDPEVKTLSKEALQLVVKSAELALAKLGSESVKVARLQNRRTLLADDVAHVCSHREAFRFLKEDIKDLTKALLEAKENNNNNHNNQGNKKEDTKLAAAAAGTKPLTSYFGVNK